MLLTSGVQPGRLPGLLVLVRSTRYPGLLVLRCRSGLEELFQFASVVFEGVSVGSGGLGGEVGDDWRRGAEQGDAGAEREGADAVG